MPVRGATNIPAFPEAPPLPPPPPRLEQQCVNGRLYRLRRQFLEGRNIDHRGSIGGASPASPPSLPPYRDVTGSQYRT